MNVDPRNMLTVGSLFAGIGGFDLGFERAGMRTLWFCEQDPFCQRVLARHWPGVPCYPDVRALVADTEGRTGGSNGAGLHGNGERGFSRAEGRRGTRGFGGGSGPSPSGQVPVPVPYVDVLCGGFPCQDLSVAGKGAGRRVNDDPEGSYPHAYGSQPTPCCHDPFHAEAA